MIRRHIANLPRCLYIFNAAVPERFFCRRLDGSAQRRANSIPWCRTTAIPHPNMVQDWPSFASRRRLHVPPWTRDLPDWRWLRAVGHGTDWRCLFLTQFKGRCCNLGDHATPQFKPGWGQKGRQIMVNGKDQHQRERRLGNGPYVRQ